jgi:hypothetical protein
MASVGLILEIVGLVVVFKYLVVKPLVLVINKLVFGTWSGKTKKEEGR